MKCPHCGIAFSDDFESCDFESPNAPLMGCDIDVQFCPECNKPIVFMHMWEKYLPNTAPNYTKDKTLVFPQHSFNFTLSNCIPAKYQDDYIEAANVLSISPRASATLSRRLLQVLLEEEAEVKKGNLEKEIEEFSKRPEVFSELVDLMTVLRKVANFGAHPKKNTNTGEIVEIEKGEAEILLEIIAQLFDVLFIRPAEFGEKMKSIQEKYGITL